MPIVPDTKNWTWVLDEGCPDCGFEASVLDVGDLGDLVRSNVRAWPPLLAHEHATLRPTGDQWSALEYGCHVRDVFRIFDQRVRLMLETDGPEFENWDQDITAVEQRYDQQNPTVVAGELVSAGTALAARWDSVEADQWARTGYRSDGSAFTVETLGRYFLHDPIHHLDDVRRGNEIMAMSQLDT